MSYKIPGNIKLLCEKEDLSRPDEQELVKQELVKFLKYYLDLKRGKNSLANVTDLVSQKGLFPIKGTVYPFERDVAGRMMRTRNYTMIERFNKDGKEEVYVIAADRDWWDKYSGWVSIGLLIFGFILGIFSDAVKARIFHVNIDNSYRDAVYVNNLSLSYQNKSSTYTKFQ